MKLRAGFSRQSFSEFSEKVTAVRSPKANPPHASSAHVSVLLIKCLSRQEGKLSSPLPAAGLPVVDFLYTKTSSLLSPFYVVNLWASLSWWSPEHFWLCFEIHVINVPSGRQGNCVGSGLIYFVSTTRNGISPQILLFQPGLWVKVCCVYYCTLVLKIFFLLESNDDVIVTSTEGCCVLYFNLVFEKMVWHVL